MPAGCFRGSVLGMGETDSPMEPNELAYCWDVHFVPHIVRASGSHAAAEACLFLQNFSGVF